MKPTTLHRLAALSGLFLACVQASGQPAANACAAEVAQRLQANADLRGQVFQVPAHAHVKAQALAELKRSDDLLAKVCPIRTQEDNDRRYAAAIARMNAVEILKRGKPGGGAL